MLLLFSATSEGQSTKGFKTICTTQRLTAHDQKQSDEFDENDGEFYVVTIIWATGVYFHYAVSLSPRRFHHFDYTLRGKLPPLCIHQRGRVVQRQEIAQVFG